MTQYEGPLLYSKAKNGAIRVWTVQAADGVVTKTFGLVGGTTTDASYDAMPTNEGRSNARDAVQQAVFEAKAATAHKLARKYATTPDKAQKTLDHLPMLAKPFHKQDKHGDFVLTKGGKDFKFPGKSQPKLDGFRCTARWEGNRIVLTSRQGKTFDIAHLERALEIVLPRGTIFDGELYVHGLALNKIASLAKKPQPDSAKLTYVVYDCVLPDPEAETVERYDVIEAALDNQLGPIVLCPTETVDDLEQARAHMRVCMEMGYEGSILRSRDLRYVFAHRANGLLKLKEFEDAEFKIVGITDKKLPGKAIFICECPGGTFETTQGNHAQREEAFQNQDRYIGRLLKVRFAFMTEKGKPFHPHAPEKNEITLREDWD